MNDTPENLRKFLESDDPAMVQMGLSMAKGSGVPEEFLPTILGLYMWNDDKTIRATAKVIFNKYADEESKRLVKINWDPRYRTMKPTGLQEKVLLNVSKLFSWPALSHNNEIALEALIRILPGKNHSHREWAVTKLGKIGNQIAVEPLIENFNLNVNTQGGAVIHKRKILQRKIAKSLGQIGGHTAINALSVIYRYGWNIAIRDEAEKSLKNLGYKFKEKPPYDIDKFLAKGDMTELVPWQVVRVHKDTYTNATYSAIKNDFDKLLPLVKWEDGKWKKNLKLTQKAIINLGEMGDIRAVEILIRYLENYEQIPVWIMESTINSLGKIGDQRATKSIIKLLKVSDRNNSFSETVIIRALGRLGDKQGVEPLLKYLKWEYRGRRKVLRPQGFWGESDAIWALGKIGDKRAIDDIIKRLNYDDELHGIRVKAAEALIEIGDERAVNPLLNTFEKENLNLIKTSANAIIKIKKGKIKEEKNIMKFIRSRDPAMVRMGASMLKGILEE